MDLSDLTSVYEAEGPFVTVHFAVPSTTEDAAAQLDVRWRDLVRELAGQGVDEGTRDALTAARGGHAQGEGEGRLMVAASGRVLLVEALPQAPPQDSVRVAALPRLLPAVEARARDVPHIRVVIDRQGADIRVHGLHRDLEDQVEHGGALKQGSTGNAGFGELSHLHRVEQSWEQSAEAVATRVEKYAKAVRPAVIVVAGDVRAVELLRRELPAPLEPLVEVVTGTRHADGSEGLLEERVAAALAERTERDTQALLERYAQERGQHDLAADGPEATVAALRMAQVETLLVGDSVDEERGAFFGPDPTLLALVRQELVDLGVGEPQTAPMVDVLLRAVVGTAADVRRVPDDNGVTPALGVGALLRFATASS